MNPFGRWPNLAAMMLGLGAEWGDRPMLRGWRDGAWHALDWGGFACQAASLARALEPHLTVGARVLTISDSRPEQVVANVALLAIEAIPVPAAVNAPPADWAYLLADSGARAAIVASAADAQALLTAAGGGLDLLVCLQPVQSDACTILHWHTLLNDPAALAWAQARAAAISREATACLMYTSGTGGAPKGVVLPHRAILSNCAGAAALVAPLNLGREIYLSILPLSHSYEHTVGQYFFAGVGAEIVFGRGIETMATDLRTIRPTFMTVVPRILDVVRGRVLAEVARAEPWRRALFARALAIGLRRLDGGLSLTDRLLDPVLDRLVRAKVRARFGGRITAIVSGGARLEPEVGRFFLSHGLLIIQGYGQTEAGPVISANPPGAVRIHTVGPPLAGVDLRIAADGEILVRGDLVMAGYWNRPHETAAAIVDGWLHTGDVGRLEDGYLVITDRKKDIIVLSSGENIAPARIEGLLMAESAIAQAVVAGDGATGLTGYLVAAEDADAPAVAAAVQRVNARLATAERVRRHHIVPAFTLANGLLTATQKIRRRLVIAQHAELNHA